MFKQTQKPAQNTSEPNNNSFMGVIQSYKLTNNTVYQPEYIIKTGFEIDDSKNGFSKSSLTPNAVTASIRVTYGQDEFGIMMTPDENGRVQFKKITYNSDIQTQTSVTQRGAESALEAIAKYIQKNTGKKYGSFFGLIRNSNSFVKYVLKHTQDPNAKKLGKLHSPFTAERAADKVWSNADVNPEISVKDLRTNDPNTNLADWMRGNKQFAHIKTLLPDFFNKLSWVISYNAQHRNKPVDVNPFDYMDFGDDLLQLHELGDYHTLREIRDDIRKKGKAARDAVLPAIKYAYEHGCISLTNAAIMLDREGSKSEEAVFKN